nr:hypothetical protein [Flavobacterium piscinae]
MQKYIQEFPRATWISLGVFLVLVLIRFLTGVHFALNTDLLVNFGYTMLYGYSLYFANSFVFSKLDDFYKDNRFTRKRIIIGGILSFFVSMFVIFLMRIFEDVMIEKKSLSDF